MIASAQAKRPPVGPAHRVRGIAAVHTDQLPGSFFGPSTLVELLRHRALHQGDDLGFRFLTDGERTAIEWTYADVDR
jgi:hypothetical protein